MLNQNAAKEIKLVTVNILKPRCFKVAIVNIMTNCPSHVTKKISDKTGDPLTKTDPCRPLFGSKTGRFSHKISIQSALGLRSPFRALAGFLHWKSI